MATNSATSVPSSAKSSSSSVLWVFILTIFLSAFLLFQVQLIISKHILPWFGGSAAVWTTNMLVFQLLLLAGYIYSHFLTERLGTRAQGKIHLGLLAIALIAVTILSVLWPSAITPGPYWRPTSSDHPVRDVIFVTLLATGIPFFVLSTTGPLLQRWFVQHGADNRTYRLYSVSNLGSLLGLLAFPLLLEPMLRLKTQGILWSILFAAFVAGCGWIAWRTSKAEAELPAPEEAKPAIETAPEPTVLTRSLWFLLAACASSLLLATTNYLCQEIVSLPLLWVLPLALYLLSFILCFDHPRWYQRVVFHPLLLIGLFSMTAAMVYELRRAQVVILPLLLFVCCMICHGELVRLKPNVRRLTSFYLAVSAGGALGGIFVAIVAPRIFKYFTEFQISLAACVLLLLVVLFMDKSSWIYSTSLGLALAIVAGAAITVIALGNWIPAFAQRLSDTNFYVWFLLGSALLLFGVFLQSRSKPEHAGFRYLQLIVGALVILAGVGLGASIQPEKGLYLGERNFYGALRVYEMAQGKALFHANTMHGAQLNPPSNHYPLAYYSPESGIGILLANHPKRARGEGVRVGVVGLGTGTLAAYGRLRDYFRFYEINPQVIDLSMNSPPVFSYLRDSEAKVETVTGDARLLLEKELAEGNPQKFDVLVLDAFAGDAIPVHLLTREAFETYEKHLRDENSVIAVHISSGHINLLPVLEGFKAYSGDSMLVRFAGGQYPSIESLWVLLAKKPEALQVQGLTPNPPPLTAKAEPRLWTDDYSGILELIY